jgi:hypothetical protein
MRNDSIMFGNLQTVKRVRCFEISMEKPINTWWIKIKHGHLSITEPNMTLSTLSEPQYSFALV